MSLLTPLCVCCAMIPGNRMGAEGAKTLSPALEHLTQLRELSLRGEYDNVFEGRVWWCMCL